MAHLACILYHKRQTPCIPQGKKISSTFWNSHDEAKISVANGINSHVRTTYEMSLFLSIIITPFFSSIHLYPTV